jgi:hypothetical protein
MQWAIKTLVGDNTDNSGTNTRLFRSILSSWKELSGKLTQLLKGSYEDHILPNDRIYCAMTFSTVI